MKNIEKIKAMNSEEMANWLYRISPYCGYCPLWGKCKGRNCEKTYQNWLEKEEEQ